MRKLFWRKAYTLIELVLAIALTAVIASLSATLIDYAVRMRRMSDAQTSMYMTSLRIHKAINAELSASSAVTLYTKAPTTYTAVPKTERVLYVNGGKIYCGNKSSAKTSLLPIANGFDSYGDVTVSSVTYRVVKSMDHLNADTPEATNLYRSIQITTTVSKGSWSYTHTSTVHFDEMILTSSQVGISTTETAFDSTKVRAPKLDDEDDDFKVIRYAID